MTRHMSVVDRDAFSFLHRKGLLMIFNHKTTDNQNILKDIGIR